MAKSKKANFSNQLDRWRDLFNNAILDQYFEPFFIYTPFTREPENL